MHRRVSGFGFQGSSHLCRGFVFPGSGFRFRGQYPSVLWALFDHAVAELGQGNLGFAPRLRAEVGQLILAFGFRLYGCNVTFVHSR